VSAVESIFGRIEWDIPLFQDEARLRSHNSRK